MDAIPRDLLVGALGSLLGALIVFLGQTGWQLTRSARVRARERRIAEKEAWKSRDFGRRQGITNQYLFAILRYLFLGNLLWLVPETSEAFEMLQVEWRIYLAIAMIARIGALASFFLGLGRILRYLRLREEDQSAP